MHEGGKILAIKVLGVDKKKDSSRHHEYILRVRWSDGVELVIFRRYTMFFEFQAALKDLFQEKSSIPSLPVPKFLHASRKFLGIQRRDCKPIEEFCQKIIQLPAHVSESEIVLRFFDQLGTDAARQESEKAEQENLHIAETEEEQQSDNDTIAEEFVGGNDECESPSNIDCYKSIADFESQNPGELALICGEIVTVIEKNDTGWWFVTNYEQKQGYAPATFLEPVNPTQKDTEEEWTDVEPQKAIYVAIEGYEAQSLDEVSYKTDEEIEVLSMSNFGWWKVRHNGKVGFSPCTNLVPKDEIQQVKKCSVKDKCLELAGSPLYSGHLNSIYSSYAVVRAPPRRSSQEIRESMIEDHVYGVLEKDEDISNNAVIYAEIADIDVTYDQQSEGLYAEPMNDGYKSDHIVIYDEVIRDKTSSEERVRPISPSNGPPSYAKVIPKHLKKKQEKQDIPEEKPECKSDSDDLTIDDINIVPQSVIKKSSVPAPKIHRSHSTDEILDKKEVHRSHSAEDVLDKEEVHKSHSTDEILDKTSCQTPHVYVNFPTQKDGIVHDYVNLRIEEKEQSSLSEVNKEVLCYKVIANYQSRGEDEEFVIKEGDVVELLAVDGSWWNVKVQNGNVSALTGWVPSLYLKKMDDDREEPKNDLNVPVRNRRSRSEGTLADNPLSATASTSGSFKSLPPSPRQGARQKSQSDPEQNNSLSVCKMQALPETNYGTKTLPSQSSKPAGNLNLNRVNSTRPVSPSDYKQQIWFHGAMNRHECEQILLERGEERDFLIRESIQRVGSYVISVKFHSRVRHFPVEKSLSLKGKLIVGKNTFQNLIEVVEFYKKNALFYTEKKEEIAIANPLPRS